MSSIDDLKSVLGDALENKGIANEIKSKLRAEVFNILQDNTNEKPIISQENLLINELIREYMEFNHYKYSKSVFLKETNQPSKPLNREIISAELHIKEDKNTKQVPLIYSILWHFLNNNESTLNEREDLIKQYDNHSSFKNKINNNLTNQKQQKKENDKANLDNNITIFKYNMHHQLD